MFVLSRVVVGLARQKKKLKTGKTFLVLIIPYWTFMYGPSIRANEDVPAGGREKIGVAKANPQAPKTYCFQRSAAA
ncbi:hypothetical protein [Pseudomonas sp. HLT2-19-2]